MLQPLLIAERFGVLDYPRIFSRSQFFTMFGTAGGPLLLGWLYDNAGGYETSYLVAARVLVRRRGACWRRAAPLPSGTLRDASQHPPGRRRRRPTLGLAISPRRFPDGHEDRRRRGGGDRRRRRADREEPHLRRRRRGRAGLRQRRQPARRGEARRGRRRRRAARGSTPTRCARRPASRSVACRRSATPRRCGSFIDPDLLAYDEVWAAAGTWHDVFAPRPDDLVRASGGTVVDLKR